MAKSLGTLGELFPDTAVQCRIKGCSALMPISGEKVLQNLADGKPARPERMCDVCYARYLSLADRAMPCATSGCSKTWQWNRYQQLEATVQGNGPAPRGYCPACQSRKSQLQDQELPCRIKGCKRTFLWSRDQQLRDGTDNPPTRACPDCTAKLRELKDLEMACRVRACTRTWHWSRYQQLENLVAGKDPAAVPRRMCRECTAKLKALQDAQVPCKVHGCTRTWAFTAFGQLEHLLGSTAGELPAGKMCKECFDFFNSTQDAQVACRHKGCSHTWTYTRSMQLHDWIAGKNHPPSRTCTACTTKLKHAADKAIPCMVPGCKGTWKYAGADQVRDECIGRTPAPRRCPECDAFLGGNTAKTIPCSKCGKDMTLSAYEQLMGKLGTFVQTSVCSSCAGQELAMQRPSEPVVVRQDHQVVRIPATGRWNSDPALVKWPPHLTPESIHKAEHADLRIVALGDDLTWSHEKAEHAWPALLESKLQALAGERASVAVLNAGIPGTNSRQAALRWPRDVAPFNPHLVILSFAVADSWLELNREDKNWRAVLDLETATSATNDLFQKARGADDRLLYWAATVLPHDLPGCETDSFLTSWANAQEANFNQCVAHAMRFCTQHKIPVLDLHSRFEVNGKKSARKWMTDWFRHNDNGAQNIANWMAEFIQRENLLPWPEKS